jgi:hypothetical protein
MYFISGIEIIFSFKNNFINEINFIGFFFFFSELKILIIAKKKIEKFKKIFFKNII